ncbi:MAG TPA: class I SAM-dependent methyltransferase [Afifellaceae bacterium]|nr:class I SAM-dependent methyltransferase [Afifellaceae bacterium]
MTITESEKAGRGQVSRSAADIYDEFFVPALFGEWSARVCDRASIGPGQDVLDVACGTGVLAGAAARRIGSGGTVTGLDCNESMLDIARRCRPEIEWISGQAESLPFADARFDAVASQFGLMFFEDRPQALSEMWRVLKPGGRLAVAVWDSQDNSPGYTAMTGLLGRLFGDEAADALRAPYCLGDTGQLASLLSEAGIAGATIETVAGRAVFPSIDAWVHTDIRGWTLADMIDDDQYERLQREARGALKRFVGADGTVGFEHPAHIVTATR